MAELSDAFLLTRAERTVAVAYDTDQCHRLVGAVFSALVATRDAATAAERERAERVCVYLAEMMEGGAGDYPKGARLRQAARMMHEGNEPCAFPRRRP